MLTVLTSLSEFIPVMLTTSWTEYNVCKHIYAQNRAQTYILYIILYNKYIN